jgi:hypothetical protein
MGWASRTRQKNRADTTSGDLNRTRPRAKEDLRLSERLVDLIAPYREDGLTRDRYELLIGAAVTAWNLSLLSEAERLGALRDAFKKAKVRDRESVAEVIVTLMRRKQQLFPDDGRTIVHWEISESADEYHVTVASLVV